MTKLFKLLKVHWLKKKIGVTDNNNNIVIQIQKEFTVRLSNYSLVNEYNMSFCLYLLIVKLKRLNVSMTVQKCT